MMHQPSTPSSLGRKRKATSPGDLLGAGKKQQSILPFLSQSSTSENASSSCSSTPQRMSDSKEDASFSSKTRTKRSKKKRSKNVSVKRRLSLAELSSEGESFCEPDEAKDTVNESKCKTEECDRLEIVRRNLFENHNEPMSQTVLVLSSEDEDFELHTSKKYQHFSSQSLVGRSHSAIKHHPLISSSNLTSDFHLPAKTPERSAAFATSTPNSEHVRIGELLKNTASIKLEEPEINGSVENDFINSLNGSFSCKSLTGGVDQASACASKGKTTKLSCSKLKCSSETSKKPLFLDASMSRNDNNAAEGDLHNLESFKVPILQSVKVENEEPETNPSLIFVHETSENSVVKLENGRSRSPSEGDLSTANIDDDLLNFEPEKTPTSRLAMGTENSDINGLLQDETADDLINQLPTCSLTSPKTNRNFIVSSSDDDGSDDRFCSPGNDVGQRYPSTAKGSGSPKSIINITILSETSCNGRISDSEDSESVGRSLGHQNSELMEDSGEASCDILPATPTALGGDQDSLIFDQTTNVLNSSDLSTAKTLRGLYAEASNVTDNNLENETNVNLSLKNDSRVDRRSCSATGIPSAVHLQDSGRFTPDQECEKCPLTGCDVAGNSGNASCSIETKDVSNDSAVDINEVQPVKSAGMALQNEHSSLSDACAKASDNSSSTSRAIPDRFDSSTGITEADLKGIKLSSKITCGVPSEPNLVLADDPKNSSFPLNPAVNNDLSDTSRRPVNAIILLDAVVSECKKLAPLAFDRAPLKSFLTIYSSLTFNEKLALESILLISLADGDRWQRCPEHRRNRMNRLASMNLVQYIGEHEDSLTLIDKFTNLELVSIFSSLGIQIPVDEQDIREILILACKDNTKFGCMAQARLAVKAVARNKFVKVEPDAVFCIKMCLELASIFMNLHDKIYRSVDIARYFHRIVRFCSYNTTLLIPLNLDTSTSLIKTEEEYHEFLNFCRLKAVFESGRLEDTSLVHITASVAVLDYSSEQNIMLKDSPLFRLICTTMVHILDEELKRKALTSHLDSNFNGNDFFSLSILLKQEFAGFGQKAVWGKKKVKCLNEVFNIEDPDELSHILQQNISAVEHLIRSDYVAGILESKNCGFSRKEKSNVAKYLRPKTHVKVLVENRCHRSEVGMVNYKALSSGKKVSFRRHCLFERYGPNFKYGLLDSGLVLLNAVYLVFWPVIYSKVDNIFVTRYQKCPLDWGSKSFYTKRLEAIQIRMATLEQLGILKVIDETKLLIEKFHGYHSIVDWTLVSSCAQEMFSILEILGLTRFSQIADYLLQHLDERKIGLPDLVVWTKSEMPPKIKFVACKKQSDPLHPHQVIFLEKLSEFGVDAEECQTVPKINKLETTAIPTIL